jgi:uncharacterized protein (TIGR02246 family)
MPSDKQAIRELIETWMRATAEGDLPQLLKLMADDVVFLTPGQPPLRKDDFARGFQAMKDQFSIESSSEVQELYVAGDLAYCWNRLDVTITPKDKGEVRRRQGYVLTILRKIPSGAWVLSRDANMLVAAP